MSKPILVAYDGSAESDEAVVWAVSAATSRNIGLKLVSAWTMPPSEVGIAAGPAYETKLLDSLQRETEAGLEQALAMVRDLAPDLDVTTEIATGPAAAVILEKSEDASMVVLGSHGRTGLKGLLLGSVSRAVATHAKCPAVVVRPAEDPEANTIVIGVDGSPSSIHALDFAVETASRRGYDITVLHAWEIPPIGALTGVPSFSPPDLIENLTEAELRAVSAELAGYRERYPDVTVNSEIIQGGPSRALTEASEHAAMVVVGSRGRGGFKGLLLGSVGYNVVHKAKCTTAIVH